MNNIIFSTITLFAVAFCCLAQGCVKHAEKPPAIESKESRILLISPNDIFFYDSKVEHILQSNATVQDCIIQIKTPDFTIEDSLRYYSAGLIILNYPQNPSLYDWPRNIYVNTHDKSFKIRNAFGRSHLDEVKSNLADDLQTKLQASNK